MSDIAIRVENLSKRYRIGQYVGSGSQYRTLRESLTNAVSAPLRRVRQTGDRRRKTDAPSPASRLPSANPAPRSAVPSQPSSDGFIWALKDVSFEVKRGEVLGIIGRNGAGKSTLLKILTGITEPTEGRAELNGRVGSLLEVGTGFHPELTGRENIYLSGKILGMSRKEIDRKFDEIVGFSGIGKYIDTPTKRFSSGMRVRLGFAVAAHLEPEILLIDEVLAVGDALFQKKCLGKMDEVAAGGRTVLFVSHNMGAIRQLCSSCIWIDKGRIREIGPAARTTDQYLQDSGGARGKAKSTFDEEPEKEFQLRMGRVKNKEGITTQKFSCDEPVIIELICQVRHQLPGLYGYLSILRIDETIVMVSDSLDVNPNLLDNLPVGTWTVDIAIPPRTLGPGNYNVSLAFGAPFIAKKFLVDVPGVICSFSLNDSATSRGNRRLGFFSTLLSWDVRRLP